jgi:hypothetical protein
MRGPGGEFELPFDEAVFGGPARNESRHSWIQREEAEPVLVPDLSRFGERTNQSRAWKTIGRKGQALTCRQAYTGGTFSAVIAAHGTYQHGTVLLDEPVNLPEGAQVRVTLDVEPPAGATRTTTDDRLSDGRPWPKTPEEIAAFLAEMDATPGLEVSDEEYARVEAERLARKA